MNNAHNSIFTKSEFELEVVSKGAFIDDDPGFGDCEYLVETFVIRLNHVALNEWIFTRRLPDDYENVGYTREEWEAKNKNREKRREELKEAIAAALQIPKSESLTVAQTLAEIFTVVTMRKVVPITND